MRRLFPLALAGLLALVLAALPACDPCTGVVGCREGAHVSYHGRIVGHLTNLGVEGTRVEFRRTGGIALEQDTFSAVSGEGGRYLLSAAAREAGTVTGEIVVTPPAPYTAYTIPDVTLSTVEVRGDGRDLPLWVADPFVDVYATIYLRATGQVLRSTPGEFRRTGGVPVIPQPYEAVSDTFGSLRINVASTALGTVEGDVLVRPAGAPRAYFVRRIERPNAYQAARSIEFLGNWGVGPWLGYTGKLVWADDGTPVAGADVVFRRSGGIAVSPAEFRVTSNEAGEFSLRPVPQAEGTVTADLLVRPVGRPQYTITGIEMPTFEADEQRSLGSFTIPR